MSQITVVAEGGDVYGVTVAEAAGATSHRVNGVAGLQQTLAADFSAERLVEASFRFLLDREPKEAILRSFELKVIGRYFPEYEATIDSYLTSG